MGTSEVTGEEKFEKELAKINKKYAGKELHHYQNQPMYKRWQIVLYNVLEVVKVLGAVCAVGVFIAFIVLILLVVHTALEIEKGCL